MGKKERRQRQREQQIEDLKKQARKLRAQATENYDASTASRNAADRLRKIGNQLDEQAEANERAAKDLEQMGFVTPFSLSELEHHKAIKS